MQTRDAIQRLVIKVKSLEQTDTKTIEQLMNEIIQLSSEIHDKQDSDYLIISGCYNELSRMCFYQHHLIQSYLFLSSACENMIKVREPSEASSNLYAMLMQNMHELEERIRSTTQDWGFDPVDVPRDGNCFFHAIVYLLKDKNLELSILTHQDLRAQTADHINKYWNRYSQFTSYSRSTYLKKIKSDGYWADELVVSALSRTFNLTLFIISDNTTIAPKIYKRPAPLAELHILSIDNNHFNALVTNPSLVPIRSVSAAIEAAELDDEFKTSIDSNGFFKPGNHLNEEPPFKKTCQR